MLTRKLIASKKRKRKEREKKASVGFGDRISKRREKGKERNRESKILLHTACGNDECIVWRLREIMPVEYQRERALPINRFAKFMVPMTAREDAMLSQSRIIPPSAPR